MQRTRYLAPVVGTLLAFGASFGSVAAADPSTEMPVARRSEYGDLELGNGLAIERLYARIGAAAERVCGDYDGRNLRERNEWQACLRGRAGSRASPRTPRSLGRAASIGARTRDRGQRRACWLSSMDGRFGAGGPAPKRLRCPGDQSDLRANAPRSARVPRPRVAAPRLPRTLCCRDRRCAPRRRPAASCRARL